MAHGHVQWLIDQGVGTIFYPSVFYERQEDMKTQNHFNCPMVVANPENIANNVEDVTEGRVRMLKPFLALTSEKTAADTLVRIFPQDLQYPGAGGSRRGSRGLGRAAVCQGPTCAQKA